VTEPTGIEIVLAVVQRNGLICLARRSDQVATARGLWSVVTGYLEPGATPLDQVWQELREELGLASPHVQLVRTLPPVPLMSPASGKQFLVHPFLFEGGEVCEVVLNWEHTDLAWVAPERLSHDDCVRWQRQIVTALLDRP
jgi:8-oxo-dGTP pyrophosphatase MutT (NUDIX family)